jgi:hypothetical protein
LGERWYWPELGRFIQQDPLGDGVNWYAYAGNNPVVWADPSGLWARERHGELADYASEFSGLNPAAREALHRGAEGPDRGFWAAKNVVGLGTWPHFGEDRSEEYMKKAVALWQGGKRNKALDTLGWGLHNLADILVHPRKPLDHLRKGFSEDPCDRKAEWEEAKRRSRRLVSRFVVWLAAIHAANRSLPPVPESLTTHINVATYLSSP